MVYCRSIVGKLMADSMPTVNQQSSFVSFLLFYCIGDSIEVVISELNRALEEPLYWCKTNSLVPHPKKCEAMILNRGRFTGPLKESTLAQHTIKWVTHSRLLGVLIDDQLNWSKHVSVVKKGFVDMLTLLKRTKFLPKNMLLDLYFRVIMPLIVYGISVWGGLTNKEGFKALETLHCRAGELSLSYLGRYLMQMF